jgi:hypothetical protein
MRDPKVNRKTFFLGNHIREEELRYGSSVLRTKCRCTNWIRWKSFPRRVEFSIYIIFYDLSLTSFISFPFRPLPAFSNRWFVYMYMFILFSKNKFICIHLHVPEARFLLVWATIIASQWPNIYISDAGWERRLKSARCKNSFADHVTNWELIWYFQDPRFGTPFLWLHCWWDTQCIETLF